MFVILLLAATRNLSLSVNRPIKKKLSDFIPGYEVNLTRFSHDPNKVIFNFSSYVLTEDEKSLLCKGLRFCIPPKKIEYDNLNCYTVTLQCLK